jgi:hypothetical protein
MKNPIIFNTWDLDIAKFHSLKKEKKIKIFHIGMKKMFFFNEAKNEIFLKAKKNKNLISKLYGVSQFVFFLRVGFIPLF